MFIENFSKFLRYYAQRRKARILGFFALSLIVGFLEFLGIALIYPFILMIVSPQSVVNSKYYLAFTAISQVQDVMINAFIIGILVVFLFIGKNVFMVFSFYMQNKFTNNWKIDINKKFMHYYLYSPYKNLLKTSASEKIYNLTFLTSQALDGFILRGINLITNSIIVLMILMLLFIKFPLAAFVTSGFVFLSMAFQNKFFKKRTKELSSKLSESSVSNNNQIIENINNLKELKILCAESYFYEKYLQKQVNLNNLLFKNNFYASIPPYIVEILIVFSLLILAGLISIQNFQNPSGMIASYAIVVAAIFRIAPALNRIQSSINVMNASRDYVKAMNNEYEVCDFGYFEDMAESKIDFREKIQLKNIKFSYKDGDLVIKDLFLELKKGEFVGIIGLSGAGKSTLADIIMGLLPVDSGEISVDGKKLDMKNFQMLRRLIGYVPQQINVLDGSFRQNVAWGISDDEISDEKVWLALEKAQLKDLVQKFKDGINSNVIVGSAGLSQGQKQRLAIARALYRDPEILIFDEATSSLDVETEYEITKMLEAIKGEKTVVAIAHRLSTLKSCDRLVYLKDGKVVDEGSFRELSSRHKDFEKLINLSNIEG